MHTVHTFIYYVTDRYLFLLAIEAWLSQIFHVLDIISYQLSIMAHCNKARRNFQNEVSQEAGKRYFDIGFCKYSIT